MYLKNIDMQGFKSFANKITLEFHDGITGIVGPNGSGKSNVADAVRWVFGEQSAKQLRGGNMQDVIFAGTESRKPLGFASVSITLDNADRQIAFDAEEVTVTRRLYRSGESEYLLNGRNCRLKDINELFYDTGIGKEGYSIIGQGQIDRILSGKAEERRELFDEAAGIVKFKRRKNAALKKLDSEQQNLLRVTDILTEITRQVGPLEEQAKRAEEYLQKRDALRTLEIDLFSMEASHVGEQRTELSGKKKIAEEQLAQIEETFAKTRQDYERVDAKLAELDESIEESRQKTIALINARGDIQAEFQRYETTLEQIGIRRTDLDARMTQMHSHESEQIEELKKLEEIDQRIEAQAKEVIANIEGTEERIEHMKEALRDANLKRESDQEAYHRDASRLESLRDLAERYEGFGNSVRKIMEKKDREPGIHGVIAELIRTKKKYETAIETALGGALQNIVTDNEDTAKRMIEFLKREHQGRATFLPITAVRDDRELEHKEALREDGVIGVASSLVEHDAVYDGIVAHLLGRTIVVDHIDHAIAISRKYRQSLRMVTLEGELLAPGGSMTGGSFRNNSNLLGRRREIDELSVRVGELKENVEKTQKQIDQMLEERTGLREQLNTLNEELQRLHLERNTAKLNLESSRAQAEALQTDYAGLKKEGEEIRAQAEEAEKKRDEIRAALEQTEKDIQESEQRAASLTEEKEQLNRDHKSFFEKRDELSDQKSRMDKELFRLESQLERLEENWEKSVLHLFEEYQITPEQAPRFTSGIERERGTLTREISELKGEIRALGHVNVNAVEEYRELKERHDFLSAQHADLVKAAADLQGIINELDTGMRKQFKEKFDAIRVEYDKVFRQLFGGGSGSIELAEDEDILEAGISIISQPPGKKLQNMMQLSGGEKALSAIALLFAIQNLKPSPFCLLDEIEAALDDTNVVRFAEYLNNLVDKTQFILITHRRGTMTAADRLYGITMQEKGISTLVSVNLIEASLSA